MQGLGTGFCRERDKAVARQAVKKEPGPDGCVEEKGLHPGAFCGDFAVRAHYLEREKSAAAFAL